MQNKIIKVLLVASVLMVNSVFCMQFTSATVDAVLDIGGRWKKSNTELFWIIELYPSDGSRLSFAQKWSLINATGLVNLKKLNLTAQDIDDDFIERMCINPCFSRLIHLDLRGNPEVTQRSLENILDSEILGKIKEMRQISGRYNKPSSEIDVQVAGTSITNDEIRSFNNSSSNPRFYFSIFYRHLVTGAQTERCDDISYGTVGNAMKWVLVEQGTPVPSGIFRYDGMDIASRETPFAKGFAEYLAKIRVGLDALRRFGVPAAITISLVRNYLEDESVAEILRLCQQDEFLRNNFTNLDLSNNRLTQGSFGLLIELLRICPKLIMNIAVNRFHLEEINKNEGLRQYLEQNRIVHR